MHSLRELREAHGHNNLQRTFVDVGRHVKVDHMTNTTDIQTVEEKVRGERNTRTSETDTRKIAPNAQHSKGGETMNMGGCGEERERTTKHENKQRREHVWFGEERGNTYPLEATLVAMRNGYWPDLNSRRAYSRSDCVRSP
jgi:hypothetical protein